MFRWFKRRKAQRQLNKQTTYIKRPDNLSDDTALFMMMNSQNNLNTQMMLMNTYTSSNDSSPAPSCDTSSSYSSVDSGSFSSGGDCGGGSF